MTRYKRHIALNEIGAKGQSKINNTSVLVVGVGGLGSPVIEYLSRAGVGVIGIIDFDNVELSNLQRQIIFSEDDLNKNKAICAQEYIKKINLSIKTKAYSEALTIRNGSEINNFNKTILQPNQYLSFNGFLSDSKYYSKCFN